MGDDENQADVIGRTLWGDPVYRSTRGKGRPPFEWTEENSFKVSMLLAAGWNNERISKTVLDPRTGKPISVPTLKRYFRAELASRDHARDQLSAKQLLVAAESAFAGNVGAMRLLVQLMDRNDQMQAERAVVAKPAAAQPQAADRLGKKAMDKLNAQTAEADLMAELEAEAARHARQ